MERGSFLAGTDVAIVSTYPPGKCGIGRFSWSLVSALRNIPGISTEVVRVVGPADPPSDRVGDVVMEVDPRSAIAVGAAAHRLSQADVAVVQHEYGIYGPDDGEAVVDLVSKTTSPVIVVLHTVLPEPSPHQLAIIEALSRSAAGLVALSASAEKQLITRYRVDPAKVTTIPHGSSWRPLPTSVAPRRRLLTWGLLGPGKGIERAIGALANLEIDDPQVLYRVVGQLHPLVLRHQGTAYRDELEKLVADTGLDGRVEFDDRYQDESGLRQAVAEADIVVLPYDNKEQICSGVLTEAVAAGRPVVATAFPHAVELLGTGAGIVVDHDDHRGMRAAISTLLTDEVAYRRAVAAATALATDLGWDSVANRYAKLLVGTANHRDVVA